MYGANITTSLHKIYLNELADLRSHTSEREAVSQLFAQLVKHLVKHWQTLGKMFEKFVQMLQRHLTWLLLGYLELGDSIMQSAFLTKF